MSRITFRQVHRDYPFQLFVPDYFGYKNAKNKISPTHPPKTGIRDQIRASGLLQNVNVASIVNFCQMPRFGFRQDRRFQADASAAADGRTDGRTNVPAQKQETNVGRVHVTGETGRVYKLAALPVRRAFIFCKSPPSCLGPFLAFFSFVSFFFFLFRVYCETSHPDWVCRVRFRVPPSMWMRQLNCLPTKYGDNAGINLFWKIINSKIVR